MTLMNVTSQPPAAAMLLVLSEPDRQILREAKLTLESPGLAVRLASAVGAPVEKLLRYAPKGAHRLLGEAAERALQACLKLAAKTLRQGTAPASLLSRRLHRLAAASTGAAGGAFGLAALPLELPVTTTLIFRSICEIARAHGEDLSDAETQLQCLSVFAMGGKAQSDDEGAFGYLILRAALAQTIANATSEMAGHGSVAGSAHVISKLVQIIARRFSSQVAEQIAAKSIPALGAVLGAASNTIFMSHYQEMAQGHFAVRELERRYGQEAVQRAYEAA